jgi:hypothetical protein
MICRSIFRAKSLMPYAFHRNSPRVSSRSLRECHPEACATVIPKARECHPEGFYESASVIPKARECHPEGATTVIKARVSSRSVEAAGLKRECHPEARFASIARC